MIVFTVSGRMTVRAALNDQNLVERVEAVVPDPVLGDTPIEVTYADYKDFGGVKFPTRVRQSAGGFPTLDLTVTEVKPNAAVDVQVPDTSASGGGLRRGGDAKVADGVWYLTGGTHHSVVIEMEDHLVVVEAPLDDARALAVIAEARSARLRQADPLRRRQPPPLRSRRRHPGLRRARA